MCKIGLRFPVIHPIPVQNSQLLFQLNDDEFSELEDVFRNMPALDMDVKVRVEDDSEEEKITAGSIVTITTTLTRRTIGDIIDAADRGEVNCHPKI